MRPEISAAVIAAGVSLLVAVVSFTTNWLVLRGERRKHERELQRRMTEKLIDRRLSAYPAAFQISDNLRRSVMRHSRYSVREMHAILEELNQWNRSDAAFLMSSRALRAFRRLRETMQLSGRDSNTSVTEEDLMTIWHAKNEFRARLREDINLVYSEDEEV